jgi:hypothetical protein
MTNPNAQALGKLGGQAKSARKSAANKLKAAKYWEDVKLGNKPAPRHRKGGAECTDC